jgi:predicted RNA binding protein YcfA (HicA-like mRNA interferase family)
MRGEHPFPMFRLATGEPPRRNGFSEGTQGWCVAGQVGSHVVMTKPGMRANLSIPQHRELSVGTLRVLIRHAGLTVDAFLDLLNG